MKNFCLLLIYLFFFYNLHPYEYNLSIVAITKSEENFIQEWVDYHLKMGVDHFYIYDNNDDNLTVKVLQPYIDKGVVDLVKWPDLWPDIPFFSGCQVYAYQNVLPKAKVQSKWLAIIDTDEFLLPMACDSVSETLDKYYIKPNPIYVNWHVFGTSGLYLKPGQSMLQNLVKCVYPYDKINFWGKTICKTMYLDSINNVHFVESFFFYVNGSATDMQDYDYSVDLLRINHYRQRDLGFYLDIKAKRFRKMWHLQPDVESDLLFDKQCCVDTDTKIIDLLRRLE